MSCCKYRIGSFSPHHRIIIIIIIDSGKHRLFIFWLRTYVHKISSFVARESVAKCVTMRLWIGLLYLPLLLQVIIKLYHLSWIITIAVHPFLHSKSGMLFVDLYSQQDEVHWGSCNCDWLADLPERIQEIAMVLVKCRLQKQGQRL